MTKKELINLVSKDTNISAKQTAEVLDSFFNVFMKNVSKEKKISLPIGTFTVSHRVARTGHNPQNGKPIDIPASKALKFKLSKSVKEELNK
ncbi:MAG: HU family DNA-binding protein [Spiroplasma sp.]